MARNTSILLGAGFSAKVGYPTAASLSKMVVECKGDEFGFHTSGQMATDNGKRPDWGYRTTNDMQFDFTLDLIQAYEKKVGSYDYENFYDFISNPPVALEELIESAASKHIGEAFNSAGSLMDGVPNIFNQLVMYYLKDGEGNKFYDNAAHACGPIFPGYTGILNCFEKLIRDDAQLHVHSLNHDLFFERLNLSDWLSGEVTDGFEELGSPYYGKLETDGRSYMVRLPYYTGNYKGRCKLYKLHGSKDYVRYYKSEGGALMTPDNFIKTKYGVGFTEFYKEYAKEGGELAYDNCWINYHAVFLTGMESKIEHYKDPLLFSKLFERFRENLEASDKLVICGYGGRDKGINEIIEKHFDFKNKEVHIIDPFPGPDVESLKERLGANLIVKDTDTVELKDINE